MIIYRIVLTFSAENKSSAGSRLSEVDSRMTYAAFASASNDPITNDLMTLFQ